MTPTNPRLLARRPMPVVLRERRLPRHTGKLLLVAPRLRPGHGTHDRAAHPGDRDRLLHRAPAAHESP